jgi:streptogrisin C
MTKFRGRKRAPKNYALLLVPCLLTAMVASGIPASGKAATPSTEPSVRNYSDARTTQMIRGLGAEGIVPDEVLHDLKHAATATGEDWTSLVERHTGIGEFSLLATELETEYPDSFVQAGLLGSSQGHYWILFTTPPDQAVIERLRKLPVNVEVRYGEAPSVAEWERVATGIVSEIAKYPTLFKSGGASLGRDAKELLVEYSLAEHPDSANGDTVMAALSSALQAGAASSLDGLLPLPARLAELAPGTGPTAETTVQGGRNLNLASTNAAECTGGFTAARTNRGIVTAAHCANSLNYNGVGGVLDFITKAQTTPPDTIDLQFHRTRTENGHTTNKQFRATGTSGSDDRTVTSVTNSPLGSTVCHWGRTSEYSCSTVVDVNFCRAVDGITRCGLDETAEDISSPGDSGGPWFLGNSARGIHTGALNGQYSL